MHDDDILSNLQKKNIGWESGQQKRASAKVPELKESLQLKWHDMEGKWPTNDDVPDFENYSKVWSSQHMTALTVCKWCLNGPHG